MDHQVSTGKQEQVSDKQLGELLGILLHQYGYDFTNYTQSSLKRRIEHFIHVRNISVYDLKYDLINHKDIFVQFLEMITINITEMFRDPAFFRILRQKIFPELKTYPTIKIWVAGCATGEEALSLAILLQESGLLQRSRIYATDLNGVNLQKARKGIIPLTAMDECIRNYHEAGGTNDFRAYYTTSGDFAILNQSLKTNIVFAHHNLVTDRVFNEFQLVLCRNVLIYFNPALQNEVVALLYESLSTFGYLALGMKESLLFTDLNSKFESVYPEVKIFKRREDKRHLQSPC